MRRRTKSITKVGQSQLFISFLEAGRARRAGETVNGQARLAHSEQVGDLLIFQIATSDGTGLRQAEIARGPYTTCRTWTRVDDGVACVCGAAMARRLQP